MESRSRAEAAGRAAAGQGSAGGTKKAGNATVADHMIATGRISAPSIPSSGVAKGNYATQDDAYNGYSKAVGDYGTRNFGNKLADFLAGPFYDENEPMAGNPRSFAGGRFHSSSNPAGMLASLASPFGSSLITSPVASKLYRGAGLPSIWHGGLDQPDMRNGPFGNTDADMGKSFSEMGGINGTPGGQPSGPVGFQSPGKITDGGGSGHIPGPVQPIQPSIMNPQPQQAAVAAKPPSIFAPKPPVQSQFQVPGGLPYGFNIFGRAA